MSGVASENILAAGALDYVYNLGERLGIFDLADEAVTRWAAGSFVPEAGASTADFAGYRALRSGRVSSDERAMLYRRVLSKGDGELPAGLVENEAFPALWATLMEQAVEFLRRSHENAELAIDVPRQPIYEATKQLQYNLTEHAAGIDRSPIGEMLRHLEDAMQVLERASGFFSRGPRANVWMVIGHASRAWFGRTPNVAAIRTVAFEGNKVFRWIAGFDQAQVREDQFQEFLTAAEAWIVAQADGGGSQRKQATS